MSMTREQLLQQQSSARVYQERYDEALAPWGVRANAPVLGQDPEEYLLELAVRAKKLLPENHELRVPLRNMPADAFNVIEQQIRTALKTAAFHPTSVPAGTIERREATDSNGHRAIKWIGQESFVKEMMPPVRRARIRNPTTDPGWFPKEVPSVWITGR